MRFRRTLVRFMTVAAAARLPADLARACRGPGRPGLPGPVVHAGTQQIARGRGWSPMPGPGSAQARVPAREDDELRTMARDPDCTAAADNRDQPEHEAA